MRGHVGVASFVLIGGVSTATHAAEVAPFRYTGVDGYVSTRYMRDDFITGQAGGAGARSRQTQSDLRTEVLLTTHSYVYHPNLLTLDLGGGPILQRARSDTDSFGSASTAMLYNLTGRATFLRDKPYRGSVFYDHLNPTVAVAPGQVLNQQNSRYGFDFSLLAPVTPVPLQAEATRSHFQGRSADRAIDDMIDRLNLRLTRDYGGVGATQAQYQATHQESSSGSPNLPIQTAVQNNQTVNADTRLQFGRDKQYDVINLVTLSHQTFALQQGPFPSRNDGRFVLDLRGRHTPALQSFAVYNLVASRQGILASTVNNASGGVVYLPRPDVTANVGAHAEDSRNTDSSGRTRGVDGSLLHQRRLPIGTLHASYTVRYDAREQQANSPQTSVIGERIVLSGTGVVALARQRVAAISVRVSNAARSQEFLPGLDYTLSVVGLDTRIQRVLGGNILDGQEVLVDYTYDVGGTYAYRQADQTANVTWEPVRYVSTYVRVFRADPRLTSGSPTFPLNKIESTIYGTRVDVPVNTRLDLLVGGGVEHEDRRETVAPYRRQAQDVYVQTGDPFFGRGSIRVATRRNRIEYESSLQNMDLTGFDLRYGSRTDLGVDISADMAFERDTGMPITRTRLSGVARTHEIQGNFERNHTIGQVLLRRDL